MPRGFSLCMALCLVGIAPLALADDYAGGAIKSMESPPAKSSPTPME